MIELRGIERHRGETTVLSIPQARFNDGEIIGLIGPPGAGKSCLLSILGGVDEDYLGEALFDDTPLRSIKRRERRNLVALLDRTGPENHDETLYNFLLLSRIAHKRFMEPFSDYDIQVVEEHLAHFELTAHRATPLCELTDSAYQRALVAFSLARTAPVTLLDNPTSALDPRAQMLLHRALARAVMSGGAIVLIASNDLNFVLQTADRVIVLREGTVRADLGASAVEADLIREHFNAEVFVTRNIYNGRPSVHFFPES
ncbi:MAG TPA: ABC transporter ATP-binding protein [Spirochaetota bacterium]|nr:ABC transporter ATP-binding protein [Spirochaetota bacterium]HOS40946.1 ABC transporter ATP-binding protein [Spirochaetota bacterium]HPI23829.1 ABC transporter ATP-binding protein [Spirochaetota bacterium]HPU89345.1 ABC transporter ATP-binding protein [Spirochaetota bacterium]